MHVVNEIKLVVLAFGALLAFFLALRPKLLLWGATIFTLVIVGILGYFFPAAKILTWVAYGAAALMYVYAFTMEGKARIIGGNEYLLKFSLFMFILISFVSVAYSVSPVFQIVAASKSLFMFGGLWVFFSRVSLNDEEMKNWLKLVLGIGLIQWIPAIYQYVFVRSYRIETGLGTVEASDSVVGTFGGSMEGGGLTAVLAFYLVLLLIAMASLASEKIIRTKHYLLTSLFLLAPLFIMEVKVIFFYLPVGMIVLFRKSIFKSPLKAILGSASIVIFMGIMLVAYQYFHWSAQGGDLVSNFEKSFAYSFQKEGGYFAQQTGALTRVGALDFWLTEHSGKNYIKIFIGHGLGASKTRGQLQGEMAYIYFPKNIDQTGLALMLWDVGVLGVLSLYAILLAMYWRTNYLIKMAPAHHWKKALARTLNAAIPLFGMATLYRNDIPYAAPMMFILFSVFGLSAWLRRNINLTDIDSNSERQTLQRQSFDYSAKSFLRDI